MPHPAMALLPAGRITLRDARRGTTRDVELAAFEMALSPVHDPVTGQPTAPLTWFDAVDLCNELSTAEDLRPAYSRAADGRTITWDPTADGYRLPTEAEWEYACRAGTTAPTYGPLEDVGLRVARGPVGSSGAAQGWSHEADRERAAIRGPLPVGWTPLRELAR